MKLASFDVGRRNLAMCIIQNNIILDWEVFDLGQRRGVSLIREMQRQFRTRPHLATLDACIVERQPSANPQMRVIEAAVEAYFVFLGTPKVLDYSPRYKLSHVDGVSGRGNYAQRKKASIREAEKFLEEHPSGGMERVFKTSKKKDDLADALIQALHFLKEPLDTSGPPAPSFILAREPQDKGNRGKVFTRSQVKWWVQKWVAEAMSQQTMAPRSESDIVAGNFKGHSRVKRSIERWWKSVDECIEHINIPRPSRVRATTSAEPDAPFAEPVIFSEQ